MRNQALNLEPEDIGVHPSKDLKHVYGILMEIGHPDGVVTLIVLADGTVSLYYENGGGLIGAGGEAEVHKAAEEFLKVVEGHHRHFQEAHVGKLPEDGQVLFYVLTYRRGILTGEASETKLGDKTHGLTEVFFAGHNVISELRKIEEFREAE
ncbi:MAG: hypothetical protein KC900_06070 [Candidatus Omnitrophica bacterium]|nr:hypothetical protein [Candidatus Omnitrophota bacterium]